MGAARVRVIYRLPFSFLAKKILYPSYRYPEGTNVAQECFLSLDKEFLRDDPCCEEAFFTTVNGISSILFDSIFLSGLKHEKQLISAHFINLRVFGSD
uniref:Uncharacterized protein n=1 Tax=Oryza meridionalis TaxID=40149 RepID=A0A0E0DLE3_9ORYZ